MLLRNLAIVLGWLFSSLVFAGEPIKLYPGPPPGSESWTHRENSYYSEIFKTEVVTNVAIPTLTAFLPDPELATGTGVIIAPGGGFYALSINSEGNDVARWLNAKGVAAFVLRYRLIPSGQDAVAEMMAKSAAERQQDMAVTVPLASADGLAAIALVRARAEEFNVGVDRIGFMGFSAGGMITANAAFSYDEDNRPDFVAPIYAAADNFADTPMWDDTPPAFIVAATDDQLGLAKDSVMLYNKWMNAGHSVELHLYATGGHGFGMRTQNMPADTWIERFGDWLGAQGLLRPVQ